MMFEMMIKALLMMMRMKDRKFASFAIAWAAILETELRLE